MGQHDGANGSLTTQRASNSGSIGISKPENRQQPEQKAHRHLVLNINGNDET